MDSRVDVPVGGDLNLELRGRGRLASLDSGLDILGGLYQSARCTPMCVSPCTYVLVELDTEVEAQLVKLLGGCGIVSSVTGV